MFLHQANCLFFSLVQHQCWPLTEEPCIIVWYHVAVILKKHNKKFTKPTFWDSKFWWIPFVLGVSAHGRYILHVALLGFKNILIIANNQNLIFQMRPSDQPVVFYGSHLYRHHVCSALLAFRQRKWSAHLELSSRQYSRTYLLDSRNVLSPSLLYLCCRL